jgi:hypothetical protein
MLDKLARSVALVEQMPAMEIFVIAAKQGAIIQALGKDSQIDGTHISN